MQGFWEQYWKDYIKLNADLESRPLIKKEGQLKCIYLECADGQLSSKILDTIIQLYPRFNPRI